jgi:hypothetical protein
MRQVYNNSMTAASADWATPLEAGKNTVNVLPAPASLSIWSRP